MHKRTPKIIALSLISIVLVGLPHFTDAQTATRNNLIVDVRWGNVLGDVTNREQSIWNGSASTSENTGTVTLLRSMLFERDDAVTSRANPVSWNSYIYGHWDGLRLHVNGSISDTLIVATEQGEVSIPLSELASATGELVYDMGEGREIILNARSHQSVWFLRIDWGSRQHVRNLNAVESGPSIDSRAGLTVLPQLYDLSGSLTASAGLGTRLKSVMSFEEWQNDAVVASDEHSIVWASEIATNHCRGLVCPAASVAPERIIPIFGDRDGLIIRLSALDSFSRAESVTVTFDSEEINYSNSFAVEELLRERTITDELMVSGIADSMSVTLSLHRLPNRVLIKTIDDPTVYYLEDDIARPISSPVVVEEQGLDLSQVIEVSPEELMQFAVEEPLPFPEGSLIKGSGQEVYVISEGKRRAFNSYPAFTRLGYRPDQIRTVPDLDLQNVALGEDVGEQSQQPSGNLVKFEGDATVYQVRGRSLTPIPSVEVFRANRLEFDRIVGLPANVKNFFHVNAQDPLALPDGTVVKGENETVYLVEEGFARPFSSAEDFSSLKLTDRSIISVPQSQIDALPKGEEAVGF